MKIRYKVKGYPTLKTFAVGANTMRSKGFNLTTWTIDPNARRGQKFVAVFTKAAPGLFR